MINKEEIKHIVKLARLVLTQEEEKKFQKELSLILDYFKILEEVDTSKVEASFHPTEKFMSKVLREDKEKPALGETIEKLIDLAPLKEKRYIKVKRVGDANLV
jgi:aspartyl-tRNA(Asn)/glutamyl-tRNA(Gln) amidotransferase subunit C